MLWSDWVLVAWISIVALASVSIVEKPRKPLEAGVAMWSVLLSAALIVMLVVTHTQS